MSTPSQHKSSIVLDYCWVCESHFIAVGGQSNVEHHHIIPRAFGGTDGPTVSLCDGCHTKTHATANAIKGGKTYFHLLKGFDSHRVNKILYMATAIYNADLATQNDVNKAASVLLVLNARHKHMIDSLKRIYPQQGSRPSILLLALESLYKKHFVQ